MIFPSIQLGVFFTIVLPLSWRLMSNQQLWKPFIVGASYVFYGACGVRKLDRAPAWWRCQAPRPREGCQKRLSCTRCR